jgi:phage N-6-adenine-methyltransferase
MASDLEQKPQNTEKDNRFTPRKFLQKLHDDYQFTVDAAGHPLAPATDIIGKIWTPEENGLIQSWKGHTVFCNPPYSNILPWIIKADEEYHQNLTKSVILVPSWTDRKWWQTSIEPFRDAVDRVGRHNKGMTVRFLPRMNFGTPEFPEGKRWKSQPTFGMCLIIWGYY